ncbi:MAG: class C sortase [Clostridiales bacterium]|nr:class C sortase [Clostridiales bacterium]
MKKRLLIILAVVFLVLGISVALYPTISKMVNEAAQSSVVASYIDYVSDISGDISKELFSKADEYNERLFDASSAYYSDGLLDDYYSVLDISGTGIMGYLLIDKISLKLPIYHGTSSGALKAGVGHLEGTSLPVGGPNTHSCLTAHRGLPDAKLFTDLDKLEIGDSFTISILDRELIYQVDSIVIVEPEDTTALEIIEGEDYCTLLTCTPYGINSHRLLVRGRRVANE